MAGTTTNYAWTYPTSTDLVKDGATAIQTAIQGADTTLFTALGGAYPGLRLIKQTTISAAASTIITGAFSAAYENYKIEITGTGTTSGQIPMLLNLRVGSTTSSASYTSKTIFTDLAGAAASWNGHNLSTTAFLAGYFGNGSYGSSSVDLFRPFLASNTMCTAQGIGDATGSFLTGSQSYGVHALATSYDQLVIGPSSGTFTGKISIYGYGIS